MKRVIMNEELYNCCEEAIDLLCGTVKKTLGPRGSNAIIDHSLFSPFITNDGVTIAKNIESEDERVNTILTLAKEASIKTDEEVGDGTTTTLVLLESIFKNGLEKIKSGKNPHRLKKELDEGTKEIIAKIKEEARIPSEEDYFRVASIAASDEEIGHLVSSVYLKLNSKGSLKIEESREKETYVKYVNGYTLDTILSSPYFLKEEITYNNPYVLIINKDIKEIEEISEVINFLIDKKSPSIILAQDYNEEVINQILSLNFNKITNVTLLKMPEYGTHQIDILNDIEVITDAKIVKITDEITLSNLGKCNKVVINKEYVNIFYDKESKKVERHLAKIKKRSKEEKDSYELDFLNERIAKLTNGRGIIYVGASTTTEAREKKMRFDDALYALENTSEGVVPGSGIILLRISDKMQIETDGYEILKKSLEKPFYQILENVGIEREEVYSKIKESNYELIYNVLDEKYESVMKTSVVDPVSVVTSALENASSIASMLLTTTCLIINEFQEPNKININSEL